MERMTIGRKAKDRFEHIMCRNIDVGQTVHTAKLSLESSESTYNLYW